MAEVGRRLAFWQQHVLTVERWECDAVALQVGGGDDPVGLQLSTEDRQVEAGVDAIGLVRPQQHRVRLLLRPAWQVACTHVEAEDFFASDLGGGVGAIANLAGGGIPRQGTQAFLFEQRRERSTAGGGDVDGNARHHAAFEKVSTTQTGWHGQALRLAWSG